MIKVIIVEDEALVCQGILVSTDWESIHCEVVGTARDGEEGYALIKALSPHIVITDIRMPKMSGIEMITKLKKENISCKFIILSAYSEFNYAQTALRLDVFDYLLKPFEDDALENTIQRIIELSPQLQALIGQPQTRTFQFDDTVLYSNKYVMEAVLFIQNQYHKSISIMDTAEHIGLSEGYLSRLFKQETGYTFSNYLLYYRIKKATLLLQDHKRKVYMVAEAVGYNDSMYFSNIFKKVVGMSPSHYQEQC